MKKGRVTAVAGPPIGISVQQRVERGENWVGATSERFFLCTGKPKKKSRTSLRAVLSLFVGATIPSLDFWGVGVSELFLVVSDS